MLANWGSGIVSRLIRWSCQLPCQDSGASLAGGAGGDALSGASLAGGTGPSEGGGLLFNHLQAHLEVGEVKDEVSVLSIM